MVESADMEENTKSGSSPLLLAGKLLLGLGLVILIAVLVTGLRQEQAAAPTFEDPGVTQPALAVQEGPSPLEQAVAAGGYLSAETLVPTMAVHDGPSRSAAVIKEFPRLDEYRMPATFLVTEEAKGDDGSLWYHVRVPTRPNGTTGWIKASDAQASILTHSVRISLSKHTLEVFDRSQLLKTYPVALGTAQAPTPKGEFYFVTKFAPTNDKGVYGVAAIGLSAYSDHLTDWPGEAQVGIHGTNRPELIGKNVSHGCIRMRNEDILELTQVTPLGTPVTIVD